MGATWKRLMAVAVALAFSLACQWPMIETDLLVVVINTIVCVIFVALGVSLSPNFLGARWNMAFVGMGMFWPARWVGLWDGGPWPFLSQWPIGFICIIGARAMLATSADIGLLPQSKSRA